MTFILLTSPLEGEEPRKNFTPYPRLKNPTTSPDLSLPSIRVPRRKRGKPSLGQEVGSPDGFHMWRKGFLLPIPAPWPQLAGQPGK